MATEPLRLYTSEDRRVPRRLADRLREEHEKAVANLIHAQDWADFMARRGKVYGLAAAIEWCAEIEKELGV